MEMSRLRFVESCKPTLASRIPTGANWVHEPKLDGWRIQAVKDASGVRLLSRRGADYTAKLPTLVAAVQMLPDAALTLDAELTAVDGFYALQRLMQRSGAISNGVALYAFDCLWRGDRDLRKLPLRDRRKELQAAVPRSRLAPLFRVDQYRDGEALFAACAAGEFEGVVSKRLDRPYVSGPCRDWLKTKCPGWRAANADRWRTFEKI